MTKNNSKYNIAEMPIYQAASWLTDENPNEFIELVAQLHDYGITEDENELQPIVLNL